MKFGNENGMPTIRYLGSQSEHAFSNVLIWQSNLGSGSMQEDSLFAS